MTLTFEQQDNCSIPISVRGITPDKLAGKTLAEIERMPIVFGRESVAFAQRFKVRGENVANHVWQGNLDNVDEIGAGMTSGVVNIHANAGRHVGLQMSGGTIQVQGDVGDYVGTEMSGGTIRVLGNAGDAVGAGLPGSVFGMNRGTILIDGNAGRGVGQQMRRGLIAIGGTTQELTGWHMLAGTIITFGKCGPRAGAEMKRGTIVATVADDQLPGPTFRSGPVERPPVLRLIANWLTQQQFKFDRNQLIDRDFQTFAGDVLHGARGELFVATS